MKRSSLLFDRSVFSDGRFHNDLIFATKIAFVSLSFALAGALGCAPSPADKDALPNSAAVAQQFTIARGTPSDRLRQIFARYRGSSYYEDVSEVVLKVVPVGGGDANVAGSGSINEQRAPFRVRWTGGRLNVHAYSVRMNVRKSPRDSRLELNAWFDEPETRHFDSQLLVDQWTQPESQRLNLDRVLADEVLRSRMSAGLAGPPPQLEWLFAGDPMVGLFDDSAKLTWLADETFQGQKMRRISAISDDKSYVFWIDPTTSLIRRVELPLPILPGLNTRLSTLTLELTRASFEPADFHGDVFDEQPLFTPRRVHQFVPIPPPPPSTVIGRRLPTDAIPASAIRPSAVAPRVVFRMGNGAEAMAREPGLIAAAVTRARGSNLAAVGWTVATDNASLQRDLAGAWAGAVGVVDAEALDEAIALLRLPASSIAVLGEDQTVLLTEQQITAAAISNVIAALMDHAAGVDVPQKINRDYQELREAYEAELQRHLVNPT